MVMLIFGHSYYIVHSDFLTGCVNEKMNSPSLEVLKQFNENLITSLPMKDVTFLAKLTSKGLFPGDLKAQVKSQPTSTEAADYLLDNESFMLLLSAMEEFNPSLQSIAKKMKTKLVSSATNEKDQSSHSSG